MAVISVCETRVVTGDKTTEITRFSVTYLVLCSSRADGPKTILYSGKLPKLRNTLYHYGTEFQNDAICVGHSVPRRAGSDKSNFKWIVTSDFEYDIESRPEYVPLKIEPYYISTTEVVDTALFKGFYGPTSATYGVFQDKGITNPNLVKDQTISPISNSVPTPLIPAPEREKVIAGYRVSWYKKTFLDLSFFINKMNLKPFRLMTRDAYRDDTITERKVIFDKTFEAGTLRLRDVQAPRVTFYGQYWFNYTLEFVEGSGDLYELDRGIGARAKPGDDNGRGGTYTNGDVFTGQPKTRQLLDVSGNPVTDPVMFDGNGKPLEDPKASNAIYLRWQIYNSTDFDEMNIGNFE